MATKHLVKCAICNEIFDAGSEPFVKVNSKRYAHTKCYNKSQSEKTQDQKDLEALENYIKKLFNETYINARIKKQISSFKEQYNYTYSGMLKALVYFFEIKGNSIEKANGGIGIIPYIYQEAFNYYYALWLANQKNENKNIVEYVPIIREIKIPIPQRKIKKRKLFSFLDEEVDKP